MRRQRPFHQLAQRDGGQATVELALATPLLFALLLGIVQVVVVVRDQMLAIEAARIGARAASVASDPASAGTSAALASAGPAASAHTVVSSHLVRVTVTIRNSTDVPFIGALLPDANVSATATMVLEPP